MVWTECGGHGLGVFHPGWSRCGTVNLQEKRFFVIAIVFFNHSFRWVIHAATRPLCYSQCSAVANASRQKWKSYVKQAFSCLLLYFVHQKPPYSPKNHSPPFPSIPFNSLVVASVVSSVIIRVVITSSIAVVVVVVDVVEDSIDVVVFSFKDVVTMTSGNGMLS